ncbi:MAG: DUF5996 family protein [Acidobacteriota bacterium]|nr:DUF5996 family protein [Acidobacteriota bacterium]
MLTPCDYTTTMDAWPVLHWSDWAETAQTLQLWTQVAGKIRMAKTPAVNHWWHVPLYVTTRGLGTSPIPHEQRTFSIDFDFVDQRLRVRCSDGAEQSFPLAPMSVATFHRRIMDAVAAIGIDVTINTRPSEVENPIRFEEDEQHKTYDADAARRFWCALVQADRVMNAFRASFIGKSSPVHFFWGSFDLAVTRFSGRRAPKHPGSPMLPDAVTHEAYSHEVSSAGFWPGGNGADAMFYAYTYPAPDGFAKARVKPDAAFYSEAMGEFFLPYDAVRQSSTPDEMLLDFLQSTYEAAADLAKWDRKALER